MKSESDFAVQSVGFPGIQSPMRGFTLVEVVIAVLLASIIATLAVVRLNSVQEDARHSATFEHLQRLAKVVEVFQAVHGRWPDDSYPSKVPADLEPWCSDSDFGLSPIDGYYDWNGPNGTTSSKYGIAIARWSGSGSPQVQDMQQIDDRFDDGDLTTGRIQQIQVGPRQTLHYVMGDAVP
ncbi:MAG: prepilin-type N-terminal cleavage/methylation domain-containing protein [Planctomycetota bacterium]